MNVKVLYVIGKEICYINELIEGERFFLVWLYKEDDEFV